MCDILNYLKFLGTFGVMNARMIIFTLKNIELPLQHVFESPSDRHRVEDNNKQNN